MSGQNIRIDLFHLNCSGLHHILHLIAKYDYNKYEKDSKNLMKKNQNVKSAKLDKKDNT